MSKETIKQQRIVILGGGTAGWITANLMAKNWPSSQITLVASSDIGIIGVGEGSTPHLRYLFNELGLAEHLWMPQCQATYKNGIRFEHWSTRPGFEHYFHPFASQIDAFSAPKFIYNNTMRRKGVDIHAHPDRYYLAARLAEQRLAPINAESFPFEIGYGYHFDAAQMAAVLQRHAQNNGVTFIEGKFKEAKQHHNGAIESITIDNGQILQADLFVDCTGFNALLIEKNQGVQFKSYADNLFCDAAVAIASPTQPETGSQTISRAMSNGWAWEIPLRNRVGNGYVYSQGHLSPDDAETELRRKLGVLDADIEARHLKMRVGRRQNHWHKNVLAVGLSQGFIEPLEATAIHLTIETVKQFILAWQDTGFTTQHQTAFNQLINRHFDSVRDYIVCHYKLNSRNDTEFWRANRNNQHLSTELVTVINGWLKGEDLNKIIDSLKIPGYYPPFSWHCILAGYGIFPDKAQLQQGNTATHKYDLADVDEFIRRAALNFPNHHQQLDVIHQRAIQNEVL